MEALPAVNDQEAPEYPPGFAPNQGHGSSTMAGQTFNMPTPPQNTYPFQPQYASQGQYSNPPQVADPTFAPRPPMDTSFLFR
ncbi:hypothetical protein CCACVL1_17828 [Corchorus capsularis]|uniref:Uncharacterized protein n=1 Tax=Corchorus capsularis TaxID=210143 RepID=A0A1R3HQ40_COCAP|nr:hypothetical protein CCACVL1_17828 [Corchorus capsularis]